MQLSIGLKRMGTGSFVLLVGAILLIIFAQLPAQFSDWHYFFRPAVQAWWQGGSPYQIEGFVNPPWLVFLLLPFALLSEQYGLASLSLLSLLLAVLTIRFYRGQRFLLIVGLLTPSLFSLLLLGQVDAFVLLGIIVGNWALRHKKGWGLGLALAFVLVKPQIGGGLALLWLWKAPGRLKVTALALLGIIWGISNWLVGVWWPWGISLTSIVRSSVMDVSTLAAVRGLGLSPFFYGVLVLMLGGFWTVVVFKGTINRYTTALSILTAALATPYIARHSMTIAMVTAFIWVGHRSKWGAIGLYLLSWMVLLGIWIKPWPGWWEAATWWGLWFGLVILQQPSARKTTQN